MSIYRGRNKSEIYLASLLYDAIEDQDLRSIKTLLIKKGADPNLVLPNRTISPFHLIIGNDSDNFALEVTQLILQHGGNPNIQSDDGLTPVHIAAAWGRIDILKLLLNCGGDPEMRDSNGNTPLFYAVEEKFQDCINLLTKCKQDKASVLRKEEDCNFNLTLDKIIVNNGLTMGEYEIVNEYETDKSSINKKEPLITNKLPDLPQSDSKEYVINWFNKHLDSAPANKASNQIITISSENPSEIGESCEDSFKESDEERIVNRINEQNICFRKVYRKKVKSPLKRSSTSKSAADRNSSRNISSSTVSKRFSAESGVVPLELTNAPETSSDYATCTSGSLPVLEQNVFNVPDNSIIIIDDSKSQNSINTKSEGIGSSDLSFVSLSEVYKYEDKDQGIVLFERRFLKTPISDVNGSMISGGSASLPETFKSEDIDSETIKKELTALGYNPGPITVTTKRVYWKKLRQLQRNPPQVNNNDTSSTKKVYSSELNKTLNESDWSRDLTTYRKLDEAILQQFANVDPTRKWREGFNKSSFTYLLLDPRVTNNLPLRAESMKPKEIWEIFLSAVFYVGKGKRSRPYSHLYKAVSLWNTGQRSSSDKKLHRILNIWNENCGVVCLHLFQNTIPVEAYTREAAIISAFKLENLCNAKGGNFYGVAATWRDKEKCMLGVFLLHKAMQIFLNEGERQLCPADID